MKNSEWGQTRFLRLNTTDMTWLSGKRLEKLDREQQQQQQQLKQQQKSLFVLIYSTWLNSLCLKPTQSAGAVEYANGIYVKS